MKHPSEAPERHSQAGTHDVVGAAGEGYIRALPTGSKRAGGRCARNDHIPESCSCRRVTPSLLGAAIRVLNLLLMSVDFGDSAAVCA